MRRTLLGALLLASVGGIAACGDPVAPQIGVTYGKGSVDFFPTPPPTPGILVARGSGLIIDSLASSDGLSYRFSPARPSTRTCG